MKNKQIQQNLKHGYIFLTGIVLVLFGMSFAMEMYLKGNFELPKFNRNNQSDTLQVEDSKEVITGEVVEDKLIEEAEIIDEREKVIEKPIIEEVEVIKVDPPKQVNPIVTNPTPKPPIVQPTHEIPSEPLLTGLKLQCSIINTQPFVGQSVVLDCNVTDQNGKAVSGATGSITVNWQSGVQTYQLSTSNSSGNMSKSFVVPNGNTGTVSGSVRATKSGLTVTSNFNLTVQ